MANEMTIWNTGRIYDQYGQIIVAWLIANEIFFGDFARGIWGKVILERNDNLYDLIVNEKETYWKEKNIKFAVMNAYDSNKFSPLMTTSDYRLQMKLSKQVSDSFDTIKEKYGIKRNGVK